MRSSGAGLLWFLAVVVISTIARPAIAGITASRVSIVLSDYTAGPGMPGMTMHANRSSVPAGTVVFDVLNRSKGLVHEVVIVRLDHAGTDLPYDSRKQVVAENDIRSLGEVPDLPPGRHRTLRVNMAPGRYLLICNQPGHFHAGMKMLLTVTP